MLQVDEHTAFVLLSPILLIFAWAISKTILIPLFGKFMGGVAKLLKMIGPAPDEKPKA